VSEFKISGNITANTLIQGDHAKVTIDEVARTVQENAAAVREIEPTIAELRAELSSSRPRPSRIRELLTTLGAATGALTAILGGIEKIRQAAGQ
jgi:demethoxyubiquinone hydroxylase (CLK1/Coq7/Cat5 family)